MTAAEAYAAAIATRQALSQGARATGIDEALVDELVERFYDRVRRDSMLGPIFNEQIGNRWPEHLAKLKVFWRSLALRTGEYSGGMMMAHLQLGDLTSEHFATWLRLFDETLAEVCPTPEAAEVFRTFAQSIAHRLEIATGAAAH